AQTANRPRASPDPSAAAFRLSHRTSRAARCVGRERLPPAPPPRRGSSCVRACWLTADGQSRGPALLRRNSRFPKLAQRCSGKSRPAPPGEVARFALSRWTPAARLPAAAITSVASRYDGETPIPPLVGIGRQDARVARLRWTQSARAILPSCALPMGTREKRSTLPPK